MRHRNRPLRRRRARVLAALTDQGLVALMSAGTSLLGTTVLDASEAGGMLLSLAILFAIQGVVRAVVGETMLTHIPRFDGPAAVQQTENAHNLAARAGLLGALLLAGIWWFRLTPTLNDLIWAAVILPAVLMQDACRYSYLSHRAPRSALFMDLCAVASQTALVTVLFLTDHVTSASLIASLGLGALAGVGAFYARLRLRVWDGSATKWLLDTHHLMGWFTANAVIAQLQALVTAVLVTGLIGRAGYATLRLVQILLMQPVTNISLALSGLTVPTASRFACERDRVALHRLVMTLATATTGLGLVGLIIVSQLSKPFFEWYAAGRYYSDASPLALPIWITAWLFLLQVPFGIALAGMQRARFLSAFYIALSVVSTVGMWVGSMRGGLVGAAYGLGVGAGFALLVEIVLYLAALRRLGLPACRPGGRVS